MAYAGYSNRRRIRQQSRNADIMKLQGPGRQRVFSATPERIGGREIPGIFTIPSGVITTLPPAIKLLAQRVPQLGILTTKSIGKEPRAGYREPIMAEYFPGGFINAVGLSNPGAAEFRKEIQAVYPLPGGKFLLTSIFGESVEDFVEVAGTLADCTDGFELNLSCPHGGKAGWVVGSDPEMVEEIIRAVREETELPVVCKLSPQASDIAGMAKRCRDAGASALTLVNTVGPAVVADREGRAILGHTTGGLSGRGILPVGLRCVAEASRAADDIPIIATGGISTAADVRAYKRAGASFFAVGSALAGLDTNGVVKFFERLSEDMEKETEKIAGSDTAFPHWHMAYRYLRVSSVRRMGEDLKEIQMEAALQVQPGQFFFVCIPGEGEKPFSVISDDPLTFTFRNVGNFTSRLFQVDPGETLLVRGPYGRGFPTELDGTLYFLGGGIGVVPLVHYARKVRKARKAFFGAQETVDPGFIREISVISQEELIVEVDPPGTVGTVVRRVDAFLESGEMAADARFLISGPTPMIYAALQSLRGKVADDRVHFAREDYTKCGVGLCGSCTTESGHRSCVDGPVFTAAEGEIFITGLWKRGPDGRRFF